MRVLGQRLGQLALTVLFVPLAFFCTILTFLLRGKRIRSEPRHIAITGASRGIGRALALELAKPGAVLALFGRNKEKLEEVKKACESKGAECRLFVVDVTNESEMEGSLQQFDDSYALDLLVANAGVTGDTLGVKRPAVDAARALHDVNVRGVLNTVLPVVERMRQRRRGQLLLLSSIASFSCLPFDGGYSASKAWTRDFGLQLRAYLHKYNVGVTVACPGFTRSDMTLPFAEEKPMPFMVSQERAVREMLEALKNDEAEVVFPSRLALPVRAIFAVLPGGVRQDLARLRLLPRAYSYL
ncbi:MAG: hypothetical protein MHM6MM_004628 [Cercozoa sp. M6MM]